MTRETKEAAIERLTVENQGLREAHQSSAELLDRYVELFRGAPLAFVALDGAGIVRDANEMATALLGPGARGHLEGTRLKRFVLEADHEALEQHLRRCRESDAVVTGEVRLRDSRLVQLWSRRARPALRLYPMVIVDLRDREEAAKETRRLREAEKSALASSQAKDYFIATLSHELRTPLTPVLVAVTAFEDRQGIPDSVRAIFKLIRRNILTEARLVDDLLDLTRITAGKMNVTRESVDVHDVVREALQTLETDLGSKHLTTEVHLDAEHHCASADAVRLKQVFWNLLRNALKFTPAGGTLEVRSWNNPAVGKRSLNVELSDTGIGFEPQLASSLFQPFEQAPNTPARTGGLGLGLAICKGLVELQGGRITASSRGPGMGARFVVELETTDERPVSHEPGPSPIPEPRQAALRILLVEDDEDTAEVLGELLSEAGYDIRTARSAKAALAADLDRVDLVISDIGLPDLSGLELMRNLRSDRSIKGVALSGYGTEADVRASTDAGFSAHLTKPVDFGRLIRVIQEVTHSLPH